MTRNTKTIKSPDGNKLAIVNPDAVGIDIADTEMQVCVPEDRDGDNNRRFGSFTSELNRIIAWLKVPYYDCSNGSHRNLLSVTLSKTTGCWH